MKHLHFVEILKKAGSLLGGILMAVLFASPYFLFREEIQDMVVVGYLGVLVACAISNVSVLLPTSSTVIVLAATTTLNPLLCILMGGLGTALGEQASYCCGRVGGAAFQNNTRNYSNRVLHWIETNEFLTIFLFAFVPLPVFDIVGIAAGARKISWIKYTLAAVLGKTLKFFVVVFFFRWLVPLLTEILPGATGEIFREIAAKL